MSQEATPLDPFSDLREFYRRLDEILPGPDLPADQGSNPCGTCGDCCRWFFYLSRHEWDYLTQELEARGEADLARFRVAVTPDQDERLGLPEWRCPLYVQGRGCGVYDRRPLACRLAGPYLPVLSRLPDHCIFTRPIRYSTVEEIPLWEEYVRVLRRHPSPPGYLAPGPSSGAPLSEAPAPPENNPGSPGDPPSHPPAPDARR